MSQAEINQLQAALDDAIAELVLLQQETRAAEKAAFAAGAVSRLAGKEAEEAERRVARVKKKIKLCRRIAARTKPTR